jgi:hypothetical protein
MRRRSLLPSIQKTGAYIDYSCSVNRRRPIDVESASAGCKMQNAWLLHARLKILRGGAPPSTAVQLYGYGCSTENTRAGSLRWAIRNQPWAAPRSAYMY